MLKHRHTDSLAVFLIQKKETKKEKEKEERRSPMQVGGNV